MDDSTILAQLDQARELAFSNRDVFPQVVKQILNLVSNPSAAVQRWCSVFLKQAFSAADSHVLPGVKVDLAIDALPALKVLANVRDLDVFKNAIDVSILVFKLTFRYVAENDGSSHVWSGVNDLKNELVAKFDTQFPFELTFDKEHDSLRNIDAKLELLKFVVTVVDYQLRSVSSKHYSLARINPNHTLIKPALMESEAAALVDVMLRTLQNDILVTPLVTATLNLRVARNVQALAQVRRPYAPCLARLHGQVPGRSAQIPGRCEPKAFCSHGARRRDPQKEHLVALARRPGCAQAQA